MVFRERRPLINSMEVHGGGGLKGISQAEAVCRCLFVQSLQPGCLRSRPGRGPTYLRITARKLKQSACVLSILNRSYLIT